MLQQKRVQRLKKLGARPKRRSDGQGSGLGFARVGQMSESSESEVEKRNPGRKRGRPSVGEGRG